MSRTDDLAANLAAVRARIAAAARAAGRRPEDITIVAVTKTFPTADVLALLELGVTDVGENRDQEAASKVVEVAAATDRTPRWHFVGQVQRKKAASVASYADVVHSLDRVALADALGRGAAKAGRDVTVLLQVSLDDPETAAGRAGVEPTDAVALAEHVLGVPGLRLGGVMGLAPLGGDPDPAFAVLAEVAERIRRLAPEATIVSAGMTGDLEAAIARGATHVRVGTALLGSRALDSHHGPPWPAASDQSE